MENKDSEKTNENKKKDLISVTIVSFITILILFIDSICTLVKGLKRGIIKKEVLSSKSDLGFDLEIKMKS